MNIGIIFGGKSFEHEISIITAYQVKSKIESIYNISMIYVDIDGNIFDVSKCSLKDFKECKVKYKKLNINKLKLDLIVGCMHGVNGEDGYAYDFARIHNIKYFGSKVIGASLCMDKYMTYKYLSSNGINMLETYIYTYDDYLKGKVIDNYPVIVKPLYGGSSVGIEVIKSEEDLVDGLVKAFNYSDKLIVQPYIENVKEYNMALTEFDYSNLELITNKNEIFTFNNKYSDSFKLLHQELIGNDYIDKFETIGRNVYDLLNLNGIVRIDFFMIDDIIYVNEINTTPGALSIYLFDDFIEVFNKSLMYTLREKCVKYNLNYSILKNSNINK